MLVDVLLVVGDQGLGDGLADGVDLRGVTTTGDADADVNWDTLLAACSSEVPVGQDPSSQKREVRYSRLGGYQIRDGDTYPPRTCRGRGRGGARRPCSGGRRAGRCRRSASVWLPHRVRSSRVVYRATHRWRGLPLTLTMGEGPRRGCSQVSNSFHVHKAKPIRHPYPDPDPPHPSHTRFVETGKLNKGARQGFLTAQWATAVAVFFLPKHWTLWGADIFAVLMLLSRGLSDSGGVRSSGERGGRWVMGREIRRVGGEARFHWIHVQRRFDFCPPPRPFRGAFCVVGLRVGRVD